MNWELKRPIHMYIGIFLMLFSGKKLSCFLQREISCPKDFTACISFWKSKQGFAFFPLFLHLWSETEFRGGKKKKSSATCKGTFFIYVLGFGKLNWRSSGSGLQFSVCNTDTSYACSSEDWGLSFEIANSGLSFEICSKFFELPFKNCSISQFLDRSGKSLCKILKKKKNSSDCILRNSEAEVIHRNTAFSGRSWCFDSDLVVPSLPKMPLTVTAHPALGAELRAQNSPFAPFGDQTKLPFFTKQQR